MSVKSKIGWTDRTWNPVSGCSKISPACDNCYAERMSKRMAGRFGYPKDKPFEVALHHDKLPQPLRWRKPSRIFVVSMGDLFHEDVPDEYVDDMFWVMALSKRHTFQILTKRPRRMKRWMEWAKHAPHDLAPIRDTWPLPNVWLGVTAEDQHRADDRIPVLLSIPAAVHFVSVEPMLGPIDLSHPIDWVIAGGESGPGARPMHTDWVRSLRDQCVKSDTPFFLKGWGELLPHGQVGTQTGLWKNTDKRPLRTTKKNAGRELDGRIWEQFPEKRDS
jgi:protein gp37